MVAIKGNRLSFIATDGTIKSNDVYCTMGWSTKHEVKHCTKEKILDDCPLVEIVTCKDCKYWDKKQSIV